MNGQNHNGFNSAFVLGLIGLLGSMAFGGTEAVQQKLKPEVSIKMENVTIAEALDRISRQADIQIKLSDTAVWKLPEGKDTRITATLEGSLGGSLDQMLSELFLRYSIGSEPLMIYPRPELRHILGRPTARSLKLLKNIYTNRLTISGRAEDPAFAQRSLNMFAGEPISVSPMYQFEHVTDILDKTARRGGSSSVTSTAPPTPVTLASILDDTVESLDGFNEWYIFISDLPDQVPQIRIAKRTEFAKARLEQVADVSFENEEGSKVIQALATRVDMAVVGMKGTDQQMAKRISLDAQNVTLEMALQKALRALGIRWTVNLDQSQIELTDVEPTANEPPRRTVTTVPVPRPAEDAYVGKISIPMDGGRYFIEFMLRESDLTDELRKLRSDKIRDILKVPASADANTPQGQVGR